MAPVQKWCAPCRSKLDPHPQLTANGSPRRRLTGSRITPAAAPRRIGYKSLVIDKVDGFVPRDLPWLDRLLQAGFKQDFKGLVLAR